MPDSSTLTREQIREIDRRAVEELAIPGIVLMENAALNASALIHHDLTVHLNREKPGKHTRIALVCSGGNNGGDGYAIARHLHNRGYGVELFAAKNPVKLEGDAATNHAICANMGLPITIVDEESKIDAAAKSWKDADLIIDAMLGTGFAGEVRQPVASIVDRINAMRGRRVIAIDAPSGLDCQTGQPAANTIRAELTITFVARKTGFDVEGAERCTGEVRVAEIGVPPGLVESVSR